MNDMLIIEDNSELRKNTVRMLNMMGYEVDEAGDGEEGYHKIQSGQYQLVICDIKMPKMDGYELLKKIREEEKTKNILFIFVTSNIDRDQVRKGMNYGADDYITKPYKINELIQSIKVCMNKREGIIKLYDNRLEEEIKKVNEDAFLNH